MTPKYLTFQKSRYKWEQQLDNSFSFCVKIHCIGISTNFYYFWPLEPCRTNLSCPQLSERFLLVKWLFLSFKPNISSFLIIFQDP